MIFNHKTLFILWKKHWCWLSIINCTVSFRSKFMSTQLSVILWDWMLVLSKNLKCVLMFMGVLCATATWETCLQLLKYHWDFNKRKRKGAWYPDRNMCVENILLHIITSICLYLKGTVALFRFQPKRMLLLPKEQIRLNPLELVVLMTVTFHCTLFLPI